MTASPHTPLPLKRPRFKKGSGVSMCAWQENLDRFYFERGRCCAGCDWWRSLSSQVGECTRSAPVDGYSRWAMLGIESCSMRPPPGHIITSRDHVCGDFADTFDWSSLPLPYRKRVGAPL